MHGGRARGTCKVTGLKSGQPMLSPKPLDHPPVFPEPHFLSLKGPPTPVTASPAHHSKSGGTPPGQGDVPRPNSGIHWCWDPVRTARERLRADLPAPMSQKQSSTLTLCQLQNRPAAKRKGLPFCSTPPSPAGAREGGPRRQPPAATVALKPPSLMTESKDISIRLAWIKSGFATCQLGCSGKLLSPPEPQLPDLENSLSQCLLGDSVS